MRCCLVDDLKSWLEREGIKAKLQGVLAQAPVQDQLCCGDGAHIDHETPLYFAIFSAMYNIVNECAKHLGYPLEYTLCRGNTPSAVVLILL